MLNEKLDEWGYFRAVGDYDREVLLKTQFEFNVGETNDGSTELEVTINGKRRCYRTVRTEPSVDDFRDAVRNLADGDALRFVWAGCSDSYTWYISRRWKHVYVEAPGYDEGVYLPYGVFRAALSAHGAH